MDFDFERRERGAVFTITRPERLNALNRGLWDGLESCLDELETSDARFLVVTAQGTRAFSAGSDLKDDAIALWGQQAAKNDRVRNLLLRLSRSRLFSVCALNGAAHGGGLELALACTLRVATQGATFSLPEIRLGVMPSYGGTQLLPAIIGRARAAELMLTARVLDSREALEWGLVSFVEVCRTAALDRALSVCAEVAGFSRVAHDGILRCLASAQGVADQAAMNVEAQAVRTVLASHDAKEGVSAFIDKRQPHFLDR